MNSMLSGDSRAHRRRSVSAGAFGRGRNVSRSRVRQDLSCPQDIAGGRAVNRQQDATVLHAAFIATRLVFRYSHARQRADKSSDRPACTEARQACDDGSSREQRPESGDRKRVEARRAMAGPQLYCRSFAKLPGLAPGDLDLAAVIELNV